jgi:hypothetical protein
MADIGTAHYQTKATIPGKQTDTLVVHCSDYRIQQGIREFLNDGLRLDHNFDLLVIPGGPQALALVEYLPKFSWAGWKWFRFLLDRHELKRLILLAHQDCKWYETLPMHLHGSRNLRERQEEDLRRVHKTLESDFPGLRVEAYYVAWGDDQKVSIETIAS